MPSKRDPHGFRYALQGIRAAFLAERNLRFHTVFACYVLWFAVRYYPFDLTQYAVLILCIGLVLSLEMLNTAVERAVDLAGKQPHPLARFAKDAAAGAVFIAAAASVAVGLLLFWDPEILGGILAGYGAHPHRLILLILSLVLAAFLIYGPAKTKRP